MPSSIPTERDLKNLQKKNSLVELLGGKKIWINWTLEPAKNTDDTPKLLPSGAPQFTKIPRRLSGSFASVSDPTSWSTYPQVLKALHISQELQSSQVSPSLKEGKSFSGVGIVFEDSLNIVGVDFDHYLINGELANPDVFEFIVQANSYVEKSPSGTGLHVFFQTTEPFTPIVHKHHDKKNPSLVTEIYSRGRYFTFVGEPFIGEEEGGLPVRTISTKEMNALLSILGYPWGKKEAEIPDPLPPPKDNTLNDDSSLLERMFSAKNGPNVRKLYEGDLSAHGKDHSSADMALVSHLAFWSGKNAEVMRRIWLASPLGSREKTQKRPDYVDRTIEAAIKGTTEVYTPKVLQGSTAPEIEFIMTKGAKPVPELILENICRVLEKDPRFANRFRLNVFSHMTECWDGKGSGKWINLLDKFVSDIQREISVAYPYFSKISRDLATESIKSVAAENPANPPVDWLLSLKWDESPRLNHWLYKVYGTPDDDLHQSMGANFLKGMVDRMTSPGCQMDLVLCLEGPQGTKKSSSLRVLGGEWLAENVTSLESKDDYLVIAGNILVEFSEGAILTRQSVHKLKSAITSTVDKLRPPYERGLETFPRGCVFSLSTNDTAYLKDETGGRRFLIVKLGRVADVVWLKENRDQLFAEALYRLRELKETTYEFSEESAETLRELQASRTQGNAYDEVIVRWYLGRSAQAQKDGFTTLEVYNGAINTGDTQKELTKMMSNDIANILKRELYLDNPQKTMPDGTRPRKWVPTKETVKRFSLDREHSVDGVDEFDSYGKKELGEEED